MNRRERLKRFLIKNRDRVVSAAKLAGMKTKPRLGKIQESCYKGFEEKKEKL